MSASKKKTVTRSEEITKEYFAFLDKHLEDIITGKVIEMMELNQIASVLFVSHTHLTDTIQRTMGQHPCYFYDAKIIDQAKAMLLNTEHSIADIARILTYDPSNFSKFFKKLTSKTPGQFRKENRK